MAGDGSGQGRQYLTQPGNYWQIPPTHQSPGLSGIKSRTEFSVTGPVSEFMRTHCLAAAVRTTTGRESAEAAIAEAEKMYAWLVQSSRKDADNG